MGNRLDLQTLLETILGSRNVYFQPPSTVQMKYPCIIYELDNFDTKYANDQLYKTRTRYQVTVVDKNPDSEIPAKVAKLPMCAFNRHHTADNLNHDVYNLYY